ncbi:MAG: hypothetical protein ACYC27_17715 [Armatimonadota bacterium]
MNKIDSIRQDRKIFRWIMVVIVIGVLLETRSLIAGELRDKAVALGYFGCLLTITALYLIRNRLSDLSTRIGRREGLWFVLIGSMGVIWVETLFWAAEKLLGAHGVAAHPNLLIDLLVTMPWYISMLAVLQWSQRKANFKWTTVAFLGGIYDIGADGIVSQLLSGKHIEPSMFLLLPILFTISFVVYSPMVLLPVWILPQKSTDQPLSTRNKVFLGLAPLLPLLPYSAIAIILFNNRIIVPPCVIVPIADSIS